MTRPIHPTHTHEDIQQHVPADHRAGGPAVELSAAAWYAVDVAHVKPERRSSAIAAYETLVEQARRSHAHAQAAAIFRTHDDRRIVTLAQIGGHDDFRRLKAAWDEHHLHDAHRSIAESSSLALYRIESILGRFEIDPQTHEAYGFEALAQAPAGVQSADGFRALALFATDEETPAIALYRFEHPAQLVAARPNAARCYPVKTFAPV
jgi:hypothetical protein